MARRVVTGKGKSVRLEGLNELHEQMAEVINRTNAPEVKRIYMGAALVLRDEARDLAPVIKVPVKNPKPWQRPGMLKKAIFASYGDSSKASVLVGVNYKMAPQAHWIEFGTSGTQAQPYMRPALTATRGKCVNIIAEGLRNLIEKSK